jgi:bifunctional non-homologous end joining protein LigD
MAVSTSKKKSTVRKNRKQTTAKKASAASLSAAIKQQAKGKPVQAGKPKASKAASRKVGTRAAMPKDLEPMLATLVDKPIDEPGWTYEIKWDGYRTIAYVDNGKVALRSRNNKSFDEKYYPIYRAMQKWKVRAVVDGEIIVANEKGISNFGDLQNWRSEADGHLSFYAFDLLWLDGKNLMELPLEERREYLRTIIPAKSDHIFMSDTFEATGREFFEAANKMGLEGIIAKKSDSTYVPGTRSRAWLKIKTQQRQEVIICGYTRNENTSRQFSALLLGLYENGELQFVGPVGTGFSDKMQTEILKKLKPLITAKCPFKEVPEYNKPSRFRPNPPKATVTWVKPKLVAEISFQEITKDGAIRHPSFEGLREDKSAKEVVREKAMPVKQVAEKDPWAGAKPLTKERGKVQRRTLLNPTEKTQVRIIDGHEIKFNNLDKIYWPKEKVSKRDMLNYYYQVAPYMLPYMKDRPQTLNRFPHGINGESFYQKDITGKVPSWIKPFPYYSEQDARQKNFLVCTDEASLLYIASLGCIEMNPWSSRTEKPDNPDWCIIDLDPSKSNPFSQVIETARVTRQVLDTFKIPSYPKTSGSSGIHIYIPLGAKYTYEDSKEFGRVIAKLVHRELPGFTSIERYTQKRKGKLYIDFLQNRPQATVAGPYSLRPKPGAPVSAPLNWDEVKKGLDILDFTIFNMVDRVKEVGDLFKPVLGKGIDLLKKKKEMENHL